MKVHLAQLNPIVGDISYNKNLILNAAKKAHQNKADILVTPELSLTGYPPEDLLLDDEFIKSCSLALIDIAKEYPKLSIVVGYPKFEKGKLYNAASVVYQKKIRVTYFKNFLPNYGVFDEKRYFSEGNQSNTFSIGQEKIGIIICEDFWVDKPIEKLIREKVDVILCINASPFELNKQKRRIDNARTKLSGNKIKLIYLNALGGQDDLVFDGGSFIFDGYSNVITEFPQFKEVSNVIDLSKKSLLIPSTHNKISILLDGLILSLHDYLRKNNITKVFLGLSGGIDSALYYLSLQKQLM